MTEEFSAGGIVFRKGLDSGENQNEIFILVSQHSGHHGWVFPKGHVADTIPNETEQEAAVREVQEETGITGVIVHPLQPTDYWYVFQGEKRHKTVQYFLMKYESGNTKDHGWEMENVVWLPLSEVEKKLTYKSDKKVWEEAKEMISKQTLQ